MQIIEKNKFDLVRAACNKKMKITPDRSLCFRIKTCQEFGYILGMVCLSGEGAITPRLA